MEALRLFHLFGDGLSKIWVEQTEKEGDSCSVIGDLMLVIKEFFGFTGCPSRVDCVE